MDTQERLEDHEIRILDLERTPIDLLKLLRGERVKVKFPRRYVAMWVTSVTVGIFRETAFNLFERMKILLQTFGEGDMSMDVLQMIRPDFITIALFLWVLGAVLKYRTTLTNNAIPLILLGVSVVLCSVWGFFTSAYLDGARWIDAILMCGIVHGVIVTAVATYGWDIVNGIKKERGNI